ncbi:MAG: hypothetical protein ACE5H9_16085 [Anaerolineae bacterium]
MEDLANDAPRGEDAPPTPGSGRLYASLALALSFMVGLVAGFLGRPVVVGEPPITVVVTVIPEANAEPLSRADIPAPAEGAPAESGTSEQPGQGRPTPTIMDFVLSDARHFQGSEDAPVVLVEFSDFK